MANERQKYALNFWITENKLIFEAAVATKIAGDPPKVALFYRWLLELNTAYKKLRYSSADTETGQMILLRGSEFLEHIDSHYINDLLDEFYFFIASDFDIALGQLDELNEDFFTSKYTLVTTLSNNEEVLLLAGDSTTDAPRPKGNKKKRKGT